MERTDEEFDRMITVDVLTKISEAFNVLACEMGLAPMYYRETTSNLLTKKAQETKKVICAYIDGQVDLYQKSRMERKVNC